MRMTFAKPTSTSAMLCMLRPGSRTPTATRSYFIPSPFRSGLRAVAFEALAPLAWGHSKAELLSDAELDEDGVVRSVELPWIKKGNRRIKSWDNTILGHIRISGQSLIAEVNSKERA